MIGVDTVLPNGATVWAASRKTPTEIVILAVWEKNYPEYVTWQSDNEGNTYWGHYYATYKAAAEDFAKRAGFVLTEAEIGV